MPPLLKAVEEFRNEHNDNMQRNCLCAFGMFEKLPASDEPGYPGSSPGYSFFFKT
jgi:hypothetical protein